MAEQKPTEVSYESTDAFELHVITGLRVMLGDERARPVMDKVKKASVGAFELAMKEAEVRYHALSEEDRANPARVLQQLVASSMQLKMKFIFAGGPVKWLMAIPRAIKRMIWK